MSNLLIWAHQSTIDYNYSVRMELDQIVHWVQEQKLFSVAPDTKEVEKVRKDLQSIRGIRLTEDRKITVTKFHNALEQTETLRDYLENTGVNGRKFHPDIEVGGDPAISAIRGYMLRQGPEQTELPKVCYAGLLPNNVKKSLAANEVHEGSDILKNVLRIVQPPADNAEPKSIGLEAEIAKLIIIYGPGRSIADLAPQGNFVEFLGRVSTEVSESTGPKDRVVFAIGAGKPGWVKAPPEPAFQELKDIARTAADDYANRLKVGGGDEKAIERSSDAFYQNLVKGAEETAEVSEMLYLMRLLQDIKRSGFGSRVRTFVATRAFGSDETFAQQVYGLLRHADIISSNEAEVRDLHTAANGGMFVDIPLANKLRELPFEAIKVCHSSNGAIMELGCRPEYILTSKNFHQNPAVFLEEVLRLSADGATYAMDATSQLGRMANEAMIRIYSHNTKDKSRQHERFAETFLNFTEPMPAGMIAVPSARVARPLGAVVGLGAVFDGLLLSFPMRD